MAGNMANAPNQLLSAGKGRLIFFLSIVSIVVALFASSFGIPKAHAASYCTVTYTIQNQWSGGFTGSVNITNASSSAWTSWSLAFTFPDAGQKETQGWNANWSQATQNVTATNMSYNGNIAPNATTNIGFNGAWNTSNLVPSSFAVNGNTCNDVGTTPTPGTTPTVGTTPTPPGTTPTPVTTPPPGSHVSNPYVGAVGYINPDWSSEVTSAATAKGGTLGTQMALVAHNSTAVWMDRIAAITAGRGLAGQLDAALAQQQSSGKQIVMEVVIYDLPNRDCAAIASNGELLISKGGLATYEAQFIDPIASIMSNPKYSSLRIAAIIEPDSLPNLVTNTSVPACAEAQSSGAYVQGVQYALNKLHAIPNVYNYIDIAHSGWLGWTSNQQPAINLITSVVKGTTAGLASIDGFISDTANYTPVTEPFMPNTTLQVGGQPLDSATFYQYNPYFSEAPYDVAMHNGFVAAGFPGTIGMLIDTSRDGWGGANRPTAVSTSTDVNTYVNQSRIDRRYHRGNWCNQDGAGIGARPQANPMPGIAAFVWIKPPGESDGTINPNLTTHIDSMCDPNYTGKYGVPTGALPNSPLPGQWFEAQFEQLVQNAYPSIS